MSLPPHLSHLQLAEEVEPRKPGESDSVYLLRLESMGLEPGGFFHGQAVLSKHREPSPPEPPDPKSVPRRQQGESLAHYIRRLERLGFEVVGLRWVPKEPSPPAPSGKVLQFPQPLPKK